MNKALVTAIAVSTMPPMGSGLVDEFETHRRRKLPREVTTRLKRQTRQNFKDRRQVKLLPAAQLVMTARIEFLQKEVPVQVGGHACLRFYYEVAWNGPVRGLVAINSQMKDDYLKRLPWALRCVGYRDGAHYYKAVSPNLIQPGAWVKTR